MSRSKLLLAIAALFLGFGQVCAETANSPTGIWLTQAGDAPAKTRSARVRDVNTVRRRDLD
jgi:hypothetical protein